MSAALLSYAEATGIVLKYARTRSAQPPAVRRLPLGATVSRVLAQPIVADQDQPPFARSTRDGFACRSAEANMHAPLPVAGVTHAGDAPPPPLHAGRCWQIMTGAPVPAGADAVAMLEHVEHAEGRVRLLPPRKLVAGENIVARAAQARAGDVLLSPGTRITAAQIALAASCGYAELAVYTRPHVAILTTGDELVPVEAVPGPGKIRNSNAPMLAALVAAAGGEPYVLPTAADTSEALDTAIAAALRADLLLISGGVSAGTHDLVEPALARFGAQFHFTGVRIQPGKPLVFGEVPRPASPSLPLFGLPGNPVSSAATFHLFAASVLAALSGAQSLGPHFVAARLAGHVKTKPGLTRFLPAWCNFAATGAESAAELPAVEPVSWHGSGDLAAFARANCFLVVPEDAASLAPGTLVCILVF